MTRMWPVMPTVLWHLAVSSISPLGPACRKYGSPVWAYLCQAYIWAARALKNPEQTHGEGCTLSLFDAKAEGLNQ